jgi:spore coat protein U-like protein
VDIGGFLPGGKGAEALNYSLQFTSKVKNVWGITSTPSTDRIWGKMNTLKHKGAVIYA